MGQAKKRGSFEERKAAAIKREERLRRYPRPLGRAAKRAVSLMAMASAMARP